MNAPHRYPIKLRGFRFTIEAEGFGDHQSEAEALREFKHHLRDTAADPRDAAALFGGLLADQSGHAMDDHEADMLQKARTIAAGLEAYDGGEAVRLALVIDF